MRKYRNIVQPDSIIEFSEYLGVDPNELARLIRKGKIATFIEDDMFFVDLDSLPEYLR